MGGYLPMESGILELCEKALAAFTDLGCRVEAVKPDIDPAIGWDAWLVQRNFQVGGLLKAFYDDPAKRARMKPEAIWETENYLKRTVEDIQQASQKRSSWYQSINRLFATHDFLALPGAQVFPFDKTTYWPREINGVTMNSYHQWMAVYCLITLTGCPVINVPVGFSSAGLPMGIQIIGRNQSDLAVLQIAHAFEAARGLA